MAASRGQYPRLIEGVPREGILGEGPHRLAQSVFLLQIPEHILGAVRPVLLLQVPQEDPWGYRERRGRGGGVPLGRHPPSPTLLPVFPAPTARLPPAAASARPLFMAFPAAKLRKPDVTVVRGNGSFRRRKGRASRADWRKGKPRGTEGPSPGTVVDFNPEFGRRARPLPPRVSAEEAGRALRPSPFLPLGMKAVVNDASRFGEQVPTAAERSCDLGQIRVFEREETSGSTPAGQITCSRSQDSYPQGRILYHGPMLFVS